MQLDVMLTKKTMEEVGCQHPKPTLVEVGEQHHFPRLRVRHRLAGRGPPLGDILRWKKAFHHEALQLRLHQQ